MIGHNFHCFKILPHISSLLLFFRYTQAVCLSAFQSSYFTSSLRGFHRERKKQNYMAPSFPKWFSKPSKHPPNDKPQGGETWRENASRASCHYENSEENDFREERFILAHRSKGVSPSLAGCCSKEEYLTPVQQRWKERVSMFSRFLLLPFNPPRNSEMVSLTFGTDPDDAP